MHVDQDWTNVWPAAASFKASAVPLPVRMGKTNLSKKDTKPPVQKFGNAELMKVPNFLHLTPAHIQKQCAALKSSLMVPFFRLFRYDVFKSALFLSHDVFYCFKI